MMMVGLELATSFTPSLLHHCSVSASLWKPPLWPSMVAVPLCLAKGVVQGGASPGEPPVAGPVLHVHRQLVVRQVVLAVARSHPLSCTVDTHLVSAHMRMLPSQNSRSKSPKPTL